MAPDNIHSKRSIARRAESTTMVAPTATPTRTWILSQGAVACILLDDAVLCVENLHTLQPSLIINRDITDYHRIHASRSYGGQETDRGTCR